MGFASFFHEKSAKNHGFSGFFGFSGGTFTAPTASTVGVARCHSRRLDMRYDKKIIKKQKIEMLDFFRWQIFFEKFQKSRKKNRKFSKNIFSKKWLFEIFRFFRFFEKYFSSKKKVFRKSFYFFIFLSYLLPHPCKWHRLTPPVPPVGAANAPPKIRKSEKSPKTQISGPNRTNRHLFFLDSGDNKKPMLYVQLPKSHCATPPA